MKKKIFALFMVITILASLTACGSSKQAADKDAGNTDSNKVYKLRMAGMSTIEHYNTTEMEAACEEIKNLTNGSVDIQFYPASQLGDYVLIYEEVMKGTIELACITIPSQFDVRLEAGNLPYLFNEYSEMENFFLPGNAFYDGISEVHKELGVKFLSMYALGFMGIGSKNAPENPGDPGAVKSGVYRIPPMDAYRLTAEGLGYKSTSIPYADLYSALQTGVADGFLGCPPYIAYQSFRDTMGCFVDYRYVSENYGIVMNDKLFGEMPAEYQKIIIDTFSKYAKNSFELAKQTDEEAMGLFEDYGIEVIKLSQEELDACAKSVRDTAWPTLRESMGAEFFDSVTTSIAQ